MVPMSSSSLFELILLYTVSDVLHTFFLTYDIFNIIKITNKHIVLQKQESTSHHPLKHKTRIYN